MVFAVGVFSLLFLIGFMFPIFFRAEIILFMEELSMLIEGKGLSGIFSFIFFNNIKASFFVLVLGIGVGVFPLIAAIANGYLLGFVTREVAITNGLLTMWRLLPHGIFELPAIIFSMGMGIKIGMDLITVKRRKKEKLKSNYARGLRVYLFIILPLLLIAGIIEALLIWWSI